jgi:hypothetical protein
LVPEIVLPATVKLVMLVVAKVEVPTTLNVLLTDSIVVVELEASKFVVMTFVNTGELLKEIWVEVPSKICLPSPEEKVRFEEFKVRSPVATLMLLSALKSPPP